MGKRHRNCVTFSYRNLGVDLTPSEPRMLGAMSLLEARQGRLRDPAGHCDCGFGPMLTHAQK